MQRSWKRSPILGVFLVGAIAASWFGLSAARSQFVPPPTSSIPKELTSYRDIVKQVVPAVVSIEPKAKIKKNDSRAAQPPPDLPDGIPEQFRRFFEQQQLQQIPNPRLGFGSGFVVDPTGVILTAAHVVEGADSADITMADGRKFTSSDIKSDKFADIAVIRVKTDSPLPALQFGDSAQMEVGDRVLAVGAPFGLTGTVTHGIVSAKGRDLMNARYEDFLQTDAAVNPGNSGGPLVNLAGQVIGVNTVIKSKSGGFEGVALSVSGNMAKSIMGQLLKDGVVRRGYLGIEMAREVSAEVAARFGLKNGGVLIANVRENSPAAKAGLKSDDAIVAINGKPVRENRELQRAVAALAIDQSVPISVIRGGKPVELSLKIEAQPEDYDTARRLPFRRGGNQNVEVTSVPRAGLELADLTEERAQALGMNRKSGALIASVEQGGPAGEAGLTRGLVIVKVDSKAITNAEQAKTALEAADPEKGALVQAVSPNGGTEYVVVKVQK
jgi:serine protease Do